MSTPVISTCKSVCKLCLLTLERGDPVSFTANEEGQLYVIHRYCGEEFNK